MTIVVSIQSRSENKHCFHYYDTTQFVANNDDKQKKNKFRKHQKKTTLPSPKCPSPSKAKKLTKCTFAMSTYNNKTRKNKYRDRF
jgi:hypothetical protein